jgi:hypothetical protein
MARFVVQWRFVSFGIMIPPKARNGPCMGFMVGPRIIPKLSKIHDETLLSLNPHDCHLVAISGHNALLGRERWGPSPLGT